MGEIRCLPLINTFKNHNKKTCMHVAKTNWKKWYGRWIKVKRMGCSCSHSTLWVALQFFEIKSWKNYSDLLGHLAVSAVRFTEADFKLLALPVFRVVRPLNGVRAQVPNAASTVSGLRSLNFASYFNPWKTSIFSNSKEYSELMNFRGIPEWLTKIALCMPVRNLNWFPGPPSYSPGSGLEPTAESKISCLAVAHTMVLLRNE